MGDRWKRLEKAAARVVAEEERKRSGLREPSLSELWAYHLGAMDTALEARFVERLSHFPAAVRRLAELRKASPLDEDEVSAVEVRAAWKRWCRESDEEDRRAGATAPEPRCDQE